MNAAKVMTNKWVQMLGAAVLVAVMANVSLADPPRGRDRGDGYRGGYGGYVDRDRGRGEPRQVCGRHGPHEWHHSNHGEPPHAEVQPRGRPAR